MHDTPDLVIAGGGFGGCFAALEAARRGLRTVVVERRSYLGYELAATLRLWIGTDGLDTLSPDLRGILLPEDETCGIDVDPSTVPDTYRNEVPLFRGSIKKRLLQELQDHGVTVLLMHDVAGVVVDAGVARGLLLANKNGFQLLPARAVLDFTRTRRLARLTAAQARPSPADRAHRYVIGFRGARLPERRRVPVPAGLQAAGNTVTLHAGKSRACDTFVEFTFYADPPVTPRPGTGCARGNAPEQRARQFTVALCGYLTQHSAPFADATLSEIAFETSPPRPPFTDPEALPAGLTVPDLHLPLDAACSDLAEFADSCAGVAAGIAQGCSVPPSAWEAVSDRRLPPGAVPESPLGERLPHSAATPAESEAAPGVAPPPPATLDGVIRCGPTGIPLPACALTDFDDPRLGVPLQAVAFDPWHWLPVGERCDVLVAGGGTAGPGAGTAAAGDGARTVVLEANPGLGGTQTLGLVSSYYHGYCEGFTRALDQRVAALTRELYGDREITPGRIEKMLCYEKALVDAGGRCLANTTVSGAMIRGTRVEGAVAVTDDGPCIVRARLTIDATGDGDVACFCGVRTSFGDPRTGNVQDYSQWSLGTAHWQSRHPDLDVIDHRTMSELMRGLTIAHRTGNWFDFAAMLTVRESRHVEGEYTLDLRDILEGRQFDDAIAYAATDWDPHGISCSWLGRLGFLPVHMERLPTEVPFRCCIPRGLTGLLVSAKAISATTDAACLCRMAADIQNLGFATGLAAVLAAAAGGDPRAIDVPALRARLSAVGVLPPPAPGPARGTPSERVDRLASGQEDALLGVVLLPGEQAVPLLDQAFDTPGADQPHVARALAWFGDRRGVSLLARALDQLLSRESEQGQPYDDTHPHKAGNPRAGIVDHIDDYWRVNQLLTLIGLAGGEDALAAVRRAIEQAWAGGEPRRALNPYIEGRIDMQRVPHFDRLLCIAFCAERLARPELVPPLDGLLDREHVGGNMTQEANEAGLKYHSAYAEVLLAAAAARCGSTKGARRLAQFLEDVHGILARFARRELCEMTGQDFGRDAGPWTAWLEGQAALTPVPVDQEPVF